MKLITYVTVLGLSFSSYANGEHNWKVGDFARPGPSLSRIPQGCYKVIQVLKEPPLTLTLVGINAPPGMSLASGWSPCSQETLDLVYNGAEGWDQLFNDTQTKKNEENTTK